MPQLPASLSMGFLRGGPVSPFSLIVYSSLPLLHLLPLGFNLFSSGEEVLKAVREAGDKGDPRRLEGHLQSFTALQVVYSVTIEPEGQTNINLVPTL